MKKTERKHHDPAARVLHQLISANLRHLMNAHASGAGIGNIKLARLSGLGTGSVSSILRDPDHSPSVRVLLRLATFFDVPVHTLLMDMEA